MLFNYKKHLWFVRISDFFSKASDGKLLEEDGYLGTAFTVPYDDGALSSEYLGIFGVINGVNEELKLINPDSDALEIAKKTFRSTWGIKNI